MDPPIVPYPLSRNSVLHFTLLAGIAFLTWTAYAPGLNSGPKFDDYANLYALVESPELSHLEALFFIFDGAAGPTGRPLSLFSFVLQRQHIPDGLHILLATNLAIHFFSGVAIYMLAFGLALALRVRAPRSLAILAASLWLLSPFLAPATLMIIQRMAILSGLFIFIGLALYTWGRILLATHPKLGLGMMIAGITAGTVLAVLAKENGALLPLLALVIELTILRRSHPTASKPFRWSQVLLLYLPTAAILLFVAVQVPGGLSETGWRAYSPFEGTISQPLILWFYVYQIVIPNSNVISPFYDHFPAVGSIYSLAFLVPLLAWAALLLGAFALRKSAPIVLFAIAFFLSAHMIESSVFYLELLFPHRNYVPAFSLYFFIAWIIAGARFFKPKMAATIAGVYVAVFFFSLWSVTSLWGNPMVASEVWAKNNPYSFRANANLAISYDLIGERETSRRILEDAADATGNMEFLVRTLLYCEFPQPRSEHASRRVDEVVGYLRAGDASLGMGSVVVGIVQRQLRGECEGLSVGQLRKIVEAVLENPAYALLPRVKANAHNAAFLIEMSESNTPAAIMHVRSMYDLTRHVYHLRPLTVLMAQSGQIENALLFLEIAREDRSRNFIKNVLRERIIDAHAEWLLGSEFVEFPPGINLDTHRIDPTNGNSGAPTLLP